MPAAKKASSAPKLLSGGNPQIPKGDGDAPVQAYLEAMPGWKADLGRKLDSLIVGVVPNVHKAVKWNSPFYGVEGDGWFRNSSRSRPASRPVATPGISTSARTTNSTRSSSPSGSSKRASCRARSSDQHPLTVHAAA
jgi:hypothetical protein